MEYFVNDRCIGCGLCQSICPQVFSIGHAGQAEARNDEADSHLSEAEEALQSCPVGAIEHT